MLVGLWFPSRLPYLILPMCAKANMVQLLTVMGAVGEQVVKDEIDKVSATHKTVESIRSEVTETDTVTKLQIFAREFTSLLEKGIKPSGKNPPPEMIEMLTEYAKSRGMSDPEKAAWGIAKTILKEGDRTHKQGGREVYSQELNKFVEEVTAAVQKEFVGFYVKEIKQAFG